MKEKMGFISRFLTFFWLITLFITFFLLGFRWLATMKYQLVSEYLRFWELYLPIVLSFCSVAFFIRPRFRDRFNAIYTYERDKFIKNGYVLQLFMMFFTSSALLVTSQKYFSASFGDLITIKSLDEVSEYPRERFFKIDSIAYNPYYGVFFEKNKRSLSFRNPKVTTNHYIVNPLHDSRIQYYKPPLTHWMALHLQIKISTSALRHLFTSSTPEDDIKKQRGQVYDQIDTYDISQVQFFYKPPSSGLLDDYKEVIASRYGNNIARKAVILEPKKYSFEERGENIMSPFHVFIASFLLLIFFLLIHKR